MFSKTQWLFFDIGSTLANEENVYEHLIRGVSAQTTYSYEDVTDMVLSSYKRNQNGFKATVKELGVVRPPWDPNLEFLYEDAYSVLEQLHSRYRLGIIANQEPGCPERLEKMGIAPFFDLVVYSAAEGISKPDPRIFRAALERSRCEAQDAVMIGDRIDNDIRPAKALGMRTIWIKQGYGQYWNIRTAQEMPDAAVNHLTDLLKLL